MPIRDELVARTVEALRRALEHLAVAEGGTGVGEVRAELDRLYRAHVGGGPDLVRRLGSEDLLDVLRSAGGVDGERAYLLSALIEVDAATLEHEEAAAGGASALASELRSRALDLVLEAGLARVGERDVAERVERLLVGVAPDERSPSTWGRLHRFASAQGAYARAEDALFGWLEAAPTEEVAVAGDAFYDALATLADGALEAGSLPRDEVEEGRAAFAEALRGASLR